ncbi:MAG: DUF1273 family protein [Hyphomicrobiaceae bacterium]|nr:MAG: DUF1273 family protein [Hyphomicrobiaceae bacterium]
MYDKIMAVTGHRPDKVGGYSDEAFDRLTTFAEAMLAFYKPGTVITGMALGWDQAVAQACVNYKLPFWAYCPCRNQDKKWTSPESKELYARLLGKAELVRYAINQDYPGAWCMQVRNEMMVDDSDYLAALYDGSPGGTANCVKYAQGRGKDIKQLWEPWQWFLANRC